MKRKLTHNPVEILFVSGSSLDRKGKRVIIREAGTENIIYPEAGIQDIDIKLLGITENDQQHIKTFFRGVVQKVKRS